MPSGRGGRISSTQRENSNRQTSLHSNFLVSSLHIPFLHTAKLEIYKFLCECVRVAIRQVENWCRFQVRKRDAKDLFLLTCQTKYNSVKCEERPYMKTAYGIRETLYSDLVRCPLSFEWGRPLCPDDPPINHSTLHIHVVHVVDFQMERNLSVLSPLLYLFCRFTLVMCNLGTLQQIGFFYKGRIKWNINLFLIFHILS